MPVEAYMKDAGAYRVSKDAPLALIDFIEEEIRRVTPIAVRFADSAGRKTVTKADVERAVATFRDVTERE